MLPLKIVVTLCLIAIPPFLAAIFPLSRHNGEWATKEHGLSDGEWDATLKKRIPPGMIPCTISAEWDLLIGGCFIGPFDRVDVSVESIQGDSEVRLRPLISRVLVAAADGGEPVDGKATLMVVLTLAVRPDQDEQLKEGMRQGQLHVSLSK
jgi:hypothetical protein